MKELLKKITILMSALPVATMVSLLSSSVTNLHAEYSQFSETIVTMILTIPSITVMIGLIAAPILAKKFPIKILMLGGMAFFAVSNVALVWCENFYLMLLLRGVSGIGCGMVLPLQLTLIATYSEKLRANLLGYGVTVSSLVTVALVAVSGIVVEYNWRYVFFLYAINLVPVVLGCISLPKNIVVQESDKPAEQSTEKSTAKFSDYSTIVFLYLFLMVGSYTFTNILSAEIAPYLDNLRLGGAKESGLMVGVSLIGATLSGIVFKKYIELLGSAAMTGIFVGTTVAFALLWQAPTLVFVGLACFLIGFCGAAVCNVVNYELSMRLPLSLYTGVSAATNLFMFVLQFLAPTVFMGVLALIPSGSFRMVCMIYTLIEAAFILISYFLPKILLK